MIRINLLTFKNNEEKQTMVIREGLIFFFVIVAVVAAGIFSSRYVDNEISKTSTVITLKQREIQTVSTLVKKIDDYKQKKQKLENQIQTINSLLAGKAGPVKMMDKLGDLIPSKAWLVSLVEKDHVFQLEGAAISEAIIADFMKALLGAKYFHNVQLKSIRENEKGEGIRIREGMSRTYRFELSYNVNYLEMQD